MQNSNTAYLNRIATFIDNAHFKNTQLQSSDHATMWSDECSYIVHKLKSTTSQKMTTCLHFFRSRPCLYDRLYMKLKRLNFLYKKVPNVCVTYKKVGQTAYHSGPNFMESVIFKKCLKTEFIYKVRSLLTFGARVKYSPHYKWIGYWIQLILSPCDRTQRKHQAYGMLLFMDL